MRPGSGNEMISPSHLITLLLIISSVCYFASLETCFVNTDCAVMVESQTSQQCCRSLVSREAWLFVLPHVLHQLM